MCFATRFLRAGTSNKTIGHAPLQTMMNFCQQRIATLMAHLDTIKKLFCGGSDTVATMPNPMTKEERVEIVQRLRVAHKQTKRMLEGEIVALELHPGTDIARNWPVITAAYSGLEQTIKYLIAEEKGCTIQELGDESDPTNKQFSSRHNQAHPFRTHNIAWLFSKLGEPTQNVARDFYGRFQSLHPYIRIPQLDLFLQRISGRKGTGYARWRYSLIEDRKLPRNSPEALVSIWDVCLQIAINRNSSNQRIRMPDEILEWELRRRLHRQMLTTSINRQDAGERSQNLRPEIDAWYRAAGNPLSAFAQVLWHYQRYDFHGVDTASDWLSEVLNDWSREVSEASNEASPTMLRTFVERAQGNTGHGSSLLWNSTANRFESVPWSMERQRQTEVPPNAIEIDGFNGKWRLLRVFWQAAQESGYGVVENRAFGGVKQQDGWFCTLRILTKSERDGNPILSIWEKPLEENCHLAQETRSDSIAPAVRRWIAFFSSLR